MAYDKFLIAPFDSGLDKSMSPFLTPEDSFQRMDNAYLYRGRVRKRFGARWMGGDALKTRLRINLGAIAPAAGYIVGQTSGAGNFTGIVPKFAEYRVGQTFVVGAVTFTINALQNPNVMTDSSGIVPTHTFDTTTGELIFVGAAATTDIVYHPYTTCVGTTSGAGNATGWVPGSKWKIGQQFSIGSEVFTVYQNGIMYTSTGVATTHTFSTTTGIYNFVAAAINTAIFYYPAEPVMGLDNWEYGPVNDHPAFGFDTQFAYKFTGNAWDLSTGSPTFKGTDSDFVWASNWTGATNETLLFVTNFKATTGVPAATDDPMYYWDGTTWSNFSVLTVFNAAGDYVQTARCIVPFKGYLLLLNIKEQNAAHTLNTEHTNRCRFSWIGDPTEVYTGVAPHLKGAWIEPNQPGYGGAGFVDAATKESIIGAEFIKDHLIVYFERSTWELAYTGNAANPFIFQKLNSELGTQSTFSTVVFDKVVLSIGNTGICACNGSNIDRVDDKIPNDIFDIRTTNNGVKRVAGIRDYQTEVVYWSWPIDTQGTYSNTFPAKILVYNYKNGTWSYNDDTITAWGYFEQDISDIWAGDMQHWEDDHTAWNAGVTQAQSKRIIAGNQQGFVFIIDADLPSNAQVMQVTNAVYIAPTLTLTIVDHNLADGDFISLNTMTGLTISGTGIYKILNATSKDTVTIDATNLTITGTYAGGGLAARVSKIDIITKQLNPYMKDLSNFTILKMDFCVARTSAGEISIDFSPNSATTSNGNGLSMVDSGVITGSILGTSILETSAYSLYPLELLQNRLWHSIYFQTQGDCVQARLYFSDTQMTIPTISQTGFVLEGIALYTKPTGRLE